MRNFYSIPLFVHVSPSVFPFFLPTANELAKFEYCPSRSDWFCCARDTWKKSTDVSCSSLTIHIKIVVRNSPKLFHRLVPPDRGSESSGGPTQARSTAARLHPGAASTGRGRRLRWLQHRAIGAKLLREGRQGQERDRGRALPELAPAGTAEYGLAPGTAQIIGGRERETPGQVQYL